VRNVAFGDEGGSMGEVFDLDIHKLSPVRFVAVIRF
jgi:hypothetical protein